MGNEAKDKPEKVIKRGAFERNRSLSKNHSRTHILKLKRRVILIMQFGTLSYVIGVLV